MGFNSGFKGLIITFGHVEVMKDMQRDEKPWFPSSIFRCKISVIIVNDNDFKMS